MVIGRLREPHFDSSRDVVDVGVSVCAARRFVGSVENVHASAAMKHIRSYLLLTTILAWFGKGTMFSVSEENTESAVALYCSSPDARPQPSQTSKSWQL